MLTFVAGVRFEGAERFADSFYDGLHVAQLTMGSHRTVLRSVPLVRGGGILGSCLGALARARARDRIERERGERSGNTRTAQASSHVHVLDSVIKQTRRDEFRKTKSTSSPFAASP